MGVEGHVTFSGVNIFRFGTSGKVVEIWNHRDDLGLREQLGTARHGLGDERSAVPPTGLTALTFLAGSCPTELATSLTRIRY